MLSLSALRLTPKILLSPIILLTILIGIGGFSSWMLSSLNDRVQVITQDLAPDAGLATDLMESALLLRLSMKQFTQTQDPAMLARFNQQAQTLKQQLVKADGEIQNPERRRMLSKLASLTQEYKDTFTNVVVSATETAERVRAEQMDVIGPNVIRIIDETFASSREGNGRATLVQLRSEVLNARLQAFKYLQTNDMALVVTVNNLLSSTKSKAQKLRAKATGAELEQLLGTYQTAFAQVVEARTQRDQGIAKMDEIGPQVAALVGQLSASVFASLDEQNEDIERQVAQTIISFVIVVSIGALIGIALSLLVTRGIVRPVTLTAERLRQIAEGDGDLTQRLVVKGKDEVAELSTLFNRFSANIQSMVKTIIDVTSQVGAASEELSTVAVQTSHSMSAQEQSVVRSVGLKDTLLSEVAQVKALTTTASVNADEAASGATQMQQDVVATVSAVTDLNTSLEASKSIFESLRQGGDSIAQVVDIITGITDQINLLALNAAIEAARAGEAGRGFAVVAEEVRALATKTQESTNQIGSSIDELLGLNERAVDAIANNQAQAQQASETAGQMGERLTRLISQVEVMHRDFKQINQSTEQKEVSVSAMAEMIDQIHQSAQETKVAAEQSAQASEELARLGNSLQEITSQFAV